MAKENSTGQSVTRSARTVSLAVLGSRVLGVTHDVINVFKAYPFPGNVRELENEVRRMVAPAKDCGLNWNPLLPPPLTEIVME